MKFDLEYETPILLEVWAGPVSLCFFSRHDGSRVIDPNGFCWKVDLVFFFLGDTRPKIEGQLWILRYSLSLSIYIYIMTYYVYIYFFFFIHNIYDMHYTLRSHEFLNAKG